MKNWEAELTSERKTLVEVKIERHIFQGNFALNYILRN